MGFYLEDENCLKKYISDAYLKNYLLGNNEDLLSIKSDISDVVESVIYEKLNFEIPVISISNLVSLIDSNNFSDDNSSLLLFKQEPLLAYLYLLKDGRVTNTFKNKVLYGSRISNRLETLLSSLDKKESGTVNIFAPLEAELRKLSNYKNTFEPSEKGKEAVLNSKSTYIVEPSIQRINYGNYFYSFKNGLGNNKLFAYAKDDLKTYFGSDIYLPDSNDVLNLFYGKSTITAFADTHAVSDMAIIGLIVASYAVLESILVLASFLGWAFAPIIAAFIVAISASEINKFIQLKSLIGLNNWFKSNKVIENFLSKSLVSRLDYVEVDAILNAAFTLSNQQFSKRFSNDTISLSIDTISDYISKAYSYNIKNFQNQDNAVKCKMRSYDNNNDFGNSNDNKDNLYSWFKNVFKSIDPSFSGNYDIFHKYITLTNDEPEESSVFTVNEIEFMLEPIKTLWQSGMSNDILAKKFFKTNYAFIDNLTFKNEVKPEYIGDNLYTKYVLNYSMLVDTSSTPSILNFGESSLGKVVNAVLDYLSENLDSAKYSFIEIMSLIENSKARLLGLEFCKNTLTKKILGTGYTHITSLTSEEKYYLPLARQIVLNYLKWLLDNNKTKDNLYEIYEINDKFFKEYYSFMFYLRHTMLNLSSAIAYVTSNTTYLKMMQNPFNNNVVLSSLEKYIQTYTSNNRSYVYAKSLMGSITDISKMTSSTRRLSTC